MVRVMHLQPGPIPFRRLYPAWLAHAAIGQAAAALPAWQRRSRRVDQPLLALLAEDFPPVVLMFRAMATAITAGVFTAGNRSAELAVEAFEAGRGIFGAVPVYAVGHSFGGARPARPWRAIPSCFSAVLLDPVLFTPAMIGVMALSDAVGRASAIPWRRRPEAAAASGRTGRVPGRRCTTAACSAAWDAAAFNAYIEHAQGRGGGRGAQVQAEPRGGYLRVVPAALVAELGQGADADPGAVRRAQLSLCGQVGGASLRQQPALQLRGGGRRSLLHEEFPAASARARLPAALRRLQARQQLAAQQTTQAHTR